MSDLLKEYTHQERTLANLAIARSGTVDLSKAWAVELMPDDEAKKWLEASRFWLDCVCMVRGMALSPKGET